MSKRRYLAAPYLVWIVGFTIIPLLFILGYALTTQDGSFTFSNLLAIFTPVHRKALLLSLELAFLCTLICLVLAYPLAVALKRLQFGRRGFIVLVMILPMWMNFILRIMAWQLILSKNGVLNLLLTSIGLPAVNIINTPTAILIGMVYDYLPYMILPIYNALMEMDEDVIEAAQDLGAGPFTVFRKIMIPLTLPGIISGITMVFVPSMTSFVIADVLGGGKIQLLGNVIEQEFTKSMNWNLGSGLSVALMVLVLASMMLTNRKEDTGKGNLIW